MKLVIRSWTRFLGVLFPRWLARSSRKRRARKPPLRHLMLQGLEPRALLSASIQVFNGGTQLNNGGSDSFGSVTVGSSDTQNLTVKNVGDATLTVSSDSIPYGFSSSTSMPLNISPGQSATLSVSMNTNSMGQYGGQLSLNTNDPSNSTFALTLSGNVQQGSGGGTIELFDGSTQLMNGSSDAFPSVTVGSSDYKSFNVQNTGSNTLTVSSVSLPSGYTLNGPLPMNIPPNQSVSFTVNLNTSTAGTFSGQMLVSSSDSADGPLAVNISGSVTAAPAPSMSLDDGATSIANGGSDSFGTSSRAAPRRRHSL